MSNSKYKADIRNIQCDSVSQRRAITVGTLFLIGTIMFSVGSRLFAVNRQRLARTYTDIFDPNCIDEPNSMEQQIFSIDINMGNFSFTQAKIVDAAWDTAVGQGGRLLHGWILYEYLLRSLVVAAMERSIISYQYYIAFSFSQTSIRTLCQAIKSLASMKSLVIVICTAALIYPIIYTLFFPLLWSAATGYISLSHRFYKMPDGSITPLSTKDLSLCWVLNGNKIGISSGDSPEYIEIGTDFASLDTFKQPTNYTDAELCVRLPPQSDIQETETATYLNHTLVYTSGGWKEKTTRSIWDYVTLHDITETSENFQSIRDYALSKQFIQMSADPGQWIDTGPNTYISTPSHGLYLDQWAGSGKSCPIPSPKDYSIMHSIDYVTRSQREVSVATPHWAPYNESGFEPTSAAIFVFNQSVAGQSVMVPFNSTFRLNNRTVELSAPFLDLGFGCSGDSPFTSLGNCVCFRNRPLPFEFLNDDQAICITAPGYVWGFSGYLTQLGLILEAVWMACCFVVYMCLFFQSRLIRTSPICDTGVIRLAIDLAESAYNDLGSDALCLPETDLVKRLHNVKIGYQIDELQGGGSLRYRLVSGLRDPGRIERLDRSAIGLHIFNDDKRDA